MRSGWVALLPLKPDLVVIGGISQGKDYAAIRDVAGQIRAGLPDCELLFTTGVFGSGIRSTRPFR